MTVARVRDSGSVLANPFAVFTAVWTLVLGLFSLQLTTQLVPLNASTVFLIAAGVVTFSVIYLPLAALFPGAHHVRGGIDVIELDTLTNLLSWFGVVWTVGSLAEVAFSGGVPLLWILLGVNKSYHQFGIPSFHGLMQAVYLFMVGGVTVVAATRRLPRARWVLAALFLWPVILFSRGALFTAVLESAAVWLVLHRVRWTRLLKIALGFLLLIVVFGIIGEARNLVPNDLLQSVIVDEAKPFFEKGPSGLLWAYIYLTSPLNNVVAVIDNLRPTYAPYYSTVTIFPTILRDALFSFTPETKYALGLVNEAFNTATIYVNFLADWGIAGAISIVAGLQAVTTYVYLHARRGAVWGILAYAACYQAVVLSVFADSFTTLVTAAQIALALCFRHLARRARGPDAVAPASGATSPVLP